MNIVFTDENKAQRFLAILNRQNRDNDDESGSDTEEDVDYTDLKPEIAKWYEPSSETWYRLPCRKMIVYEHTYGDLNDSGRAELTRVREKVRHCLPKDSLIDATWEPCGSGSWEADKKNPWNRKDHGVMHLCSLENIQLKACIDRPTDLEPDLVAPKDQQYVTTSVILWTGIHHLELNKDKSVMRVWRWAVTESGSIYYFTLIDWIAKRVDKSVIERHEAERALMENR